MRKILVDEEGYGQYLQEIEKLRNDLMLNARNGSTAYKDAVGDGWHDNFAFEETQREERNILSKIQKMVAEKKLLKVIKKNNVKKDCINIGDVLKISIKYDIEDEEIIVIRLTGKYLPESSLEIEEITLNSPLGKALYSKSIHSPISYFVNEKQVFINVIEKIDN